MAFLPQPVLSRPPQRAQQIRVTTRAAADGVISVSRRRRVYEFLAAAGPSAPSSTAEVSYLPSPAPDRSAAHASAAHREADDVRHDLVERIKAREAAIMADAAEKAALWEAQLEALRTESQEVVEEPILEPEPEPEVQAGPSYSPFRSAGTAEVFGASDVEAISQRASQASIARKPWEISEEPPVEAKSERDGEAAPAYSPFRSAGTAEVLGTGDIKATPQKSSQPSTPSISGVADLYAPPSSSSKLNPLQRMIDAVEDVVEDVREAVEDVIEDVVEDVREAVGDAIESFSDQGEEKADQKEPTPIVQQKPPVEEEAPEKDRTIGEVILDAIVEGVPAPDEQENAVDKTDLINLVDSGKIKNLTVTKLRRLLSQSGLKTSGRKAELIARLTSYAKAK